MCFLKNQVRKDHFLIFRKGKNAFIDQEIEVLKNTKNRHFPKAGLVHGFCPKFKLFLISVFKELCSKRAFLDILDKKEYILDQKTKK